MSSSAQTLAAPTLTATPTIVATAVATSTTPSAVAADAGGVTKMKSTKEKNTSIARRYRSQRCPRWRIRHEAAAPKTHKALLYVDGSHPFEKATETRDGITVWTRMAPGVAVKEVLAEITFPHTHRDKLWRAVNDVDRYKEFVPFVKKCEVIKRDTGYTWLYNVIKVPMTSARDYTIKIEAAPARSGAHPHVCSWTIDNARGPGEARGVIQLLCNSGSWELKEAGRGGAGTAVRYRILTDPGTALPAWLMDMVNQSSVPDVLRAFHKRADSGIYEREDAENAAAAAAAAAAGPRRSVGGPRWYERDGGVGLFPRRVQGIKDELSVMSGGGGDEAGGSAKV